MKAVAKPIELPEIPSKRYFAISEVAELCAVKPHVLRYWEQEFPQLKPVKRRGNRRYYQQDDILLIRRIRHLLYEQGFTISGARHRLKELAHVPLAANDEVQQPLPSNDANERKKELGNIRRELESLLENWPD